MEYMLIFHISPKKNINQVKSKFASHFEGNNWHTCEILQRKKKNQRLGVVLNEWYVRGTGLVTEGKQIMTQKVKDGFLFALMQQDPVPFHL